MSGSGSWKVAYADFVTAMMAFFLLMWILNMASEDTKAQLSEYFTEGEVKGVPIEQMKPGPEVELKPTTPAGDKSEMEKSYARVAAELQIGVMQAGLDTQESVDITSSETGVLLRISGNMAFGPNDATLGPEARKILDEVAKELGIHQLYVVVRGHTDASETGQPNFPSKWELSAARSTGAARYLMSMGVTPISLVGTAFADTKPLLPEFAKDARTRNRRVEFYLYRPGEGDKLLGG